MANIQIETSEDQEVSLPENFDAENAEFEQSGMDLILTAEDGTVIVLKGYFSHGTPPSLNLSSGDVLTADIIATLADVEFVKPTATQPAILASTEDPAEQNEDMAGFETANNSDTQEDEDVGSFETASGGDEDGPVLQEPTDDDEAPPPPPPEPQFETTQPTPQTGPIFRGPLIQGPKPKQEKQGPAEDTSPNSAPGEPKVINIAPEAVDNVAAVNENDVLSGNLNPDVTYPDNTTHSFKLIDNAENGTVNVKADGTYTYTPNADYDGSDSFSYQVADGAGGFDTAKVDITVTNVVAASSAGGTDGDDSVQGNAGADQLYGGVGNDYLYIDGGDTINGGDGVDRIFVLSSDDTTIDLAASNVEFASGNIGNDNFNAAGVSSNVSLSGKDGNDTLTTSSGADRLYGGNGNDILSAGEGKDRLYAGQGDDTISGGDGTDIFYFYNETGNNTITDYSAFEKLVFSGGDFTIDALSVVQDGNNAVMTFDNIEDFELTVENVNATDFDAAQGSTNMTVDFNTVV